jgi:hypothetical protein
VGGVIERIPKWLIDVGIAAFVTLLATGNALAGERHHPLVVAAVIGGSVVLVLRRRRPLVVLALVAAAAFARALAGTPGRGLL